MKMLSHTAVSPPVASPWPLRPLGTARCDRGAVSASTSGRPAAPRRSHGPPPSAPKCLWPSRPLSRTSCASAARSARSPGMLLPGAAAGLHPAAPTRRSNRYPAFSRQGCHLPPRPGKQPPLAWNLRSLTGRSCSHFSVWKHHFFDMAWPPTSSTSSTSVPPTPGRPTPGPRARAHGRGASAAPKSSWPGPCPAAPQATPAQCPVVARPLAQPSAHGGRVPHHQGNLDFATHNSPNVIERLP